MTRSRRRTPVTGITTSKSEKPYKRDRQGRERTAQRAALKRAKEDGDAPELSAEQVPWNEWITGRDGKFRFDPARHPKLMRK